MSYDYRSRTVFIETLAEESHPARYDLCADHVMRLVPPRGWACHSDLGNLAVLRPRAS